jgi:hypothetical protein
LPQPASLFVLEVEGGRSLPEAIRLEAGRPTEAMSVGSKGQWHVTGPGVLEVHGYLKFDGTNLHARSASSHHPLRVDGAPLGGEWERLRPPCRIAAGQVTLLFAVTTGAHPHAAGTGPQVSGELEATRIEPLQAPGAFSEPFPTLVDDPTHPLGDGTTPREPMGAAASATEPRGRLQPDDPSATRIDVARSGQAQPAKKTAFDSAVPIDVPPSPPAVSAAARTRWLDALREHWRRASLPQKLTLLLLPLAFFAVRELFTASDTPMPHRASAGSAAVQSSGPTQGPSAPRPIQSTPSPDPTAAPAPTPSGKTLASLAVDAVAAGAYQEAAIRYDALAQQYPDRAAYREAARILRSKLDAGAR